MRQKYAYFIVESLTFEDEAAERLDGYVLSQMLTLCGIENRYHFIRTKMELRHVLELFRESNYKYLHFSSHGSERTIDLALETVRFAEFARIVGPYLSRRRLSISACEAPRFELAQHLISQYNCLSVAGSPQEIEFSKSGVFWSTLYYLLHRIDKHKIARKSMIAALESTSNLFDIELNYFSLLSRETKDSKTHLRERNIRDGAVWLERNRKTRHTNINRI